MVRGRDGQIAGGTEYTTTSGEIVLSGSEFSRDVFATLLDFGREGVNPFETVWFWYESQSGSVEAEAWVAHSFFVAHGDRIIRESVTFADDREIRITPGSRGFTPSVFVKVEDHDFGDRDPRGFDTLASDAAWRKAGTRWWYRKFYQETHAGQLMVLRPDEPALHHFPEGRFRPEARLAALERRLAQIGSLLWVLVTLAALTVLILLV